MMYVDMICIKDYLSDKTNYTEPILFGERVKVKHEVGYLWCVDRTNGDSLPVPSDDLKSFFMSTERWREMQLNICLKEEI